MYLKASDVRALAELASWDDCVDGRLCYAAPFPVAPAYAVPMGPADVVCAPGYIFSPGRGCEPIDVGENEQRPYGVPLDEFIREYPFVADRVDVQMARCPDAIPEILVWLVAGETALPLPASWRGYPVIQRGPVYALPLGALGGEEPIPPPNAQESAFPVGVAAVIFGLVIVGFVASFFVKRSPAGRWYLGGRR